jgi:hypothetical protein
MITPGEEKFIARHAYVPEHLPGYGKVFSGGEPFLVEDHLCYLRGGTLIFVGYPLKEPYEEKRMQALLPEIVRRFRPSRVALMAPSFSDPTGERKQADHYYRLDLKSSRVPSKVKNMIHRAGRELRIERIEKSREFRADHRKLIVDFLGSKEVEEGTRMIFAKIGDYLSSVPTARVFEARDSQGLLAGFDVADFAAQDYVFYLFNFRARPSPVPGTSDLLLQALIREGQELGKSFVNLGLGINEGVAFFKKKWGGSPFLRHEVILFSPSRPSFWESIVEGMLRR